MNLEYFMTCPDAAAKLLNAVYRNAMLVLTWKFGPESFVFPPAV
jgi:hypothetical protein